MSTLHKTCASARRHASTRGISLVEMMVTMTIIAVGLMALVSSLIAAVRTDRETREMVLAMSCARNAFENMKNATAVSFGSLYNNYKTPSAAIYTSSSQWTGASGFWPAPIAGNDRLTGDGVTPMYQAFFPTNAAGHLDETKQYQGATAGSYIAANDATYDKSRTMPFGGRDLNGDGDRTDIDVDATYSLLPVRILITYRGIQGVVSSVDLSGMLNP